MLCVEKQPKGLQAFARRFISRETLEGQTSVDSGKRFGITVLGGAVIAASLWNLFEASWDIKMLTRMVEQAPLAPFYLWQGYNLLKRGELEDLQRQKDEKLMEIRERLFSENTDRTF